jgi:septum formation protein
LNFVLASASERRQELLTRLVDNFDIIVSDFDEQSINKMHSISEFVQNIALGKAKDVAVRLQEGYVVIAADTVVEVDGEILGKPKDEEQAFRTLSKLSGKTHRVFTGLVLINTTTNKILKDTEVTEVIFSELNEEDIKKYIQSGEPMDKAGSYGIQGKGGIFIEKISGCYYNVVGLPLNRLNKMLKEII